MSKKVLLSGIQPSGKSHIGNYFGMMKQMVDLQNDYDMYLMIADYHALKSVKDPKVLSENILAVLLDFLALEINPKKVVFFKQSDVSEHTELTWIFDTFISMTYLTQAHAYKDALSKEKQKIYNNDPLVKGLGTGVNEQQLSSKIEDLALSFIDVGTFNYPVLMASDILLYDTDIVPVGRDQEQHVETARAVARKFNNQYGVIFKLPEAKILENVATVPGVDGRKMSKSYGNTIPLFAEYEEIKKAVMSIVTDSGASIPENVYAIHKLFRSETELKKIYEEKSGKYKELKELLIEDLEKFIAPLRERRKKFEKDIPAALAILKEGGKKAKKVASKKMEEVREKIGVSVY